MANDGAPPPDINAQLQQMQSMLAAARGNDGKGAPILMCLRDVKIASLSIENISPIFKPLPTVASAGKPKWADKMLQAVQGMGEDFKKMAQNGSVIYTGTITNGAPVIAAATPAGAANDGSYSISVNG